MNDFEMRLRLQNVAAYRELRRSVQKSGRENVVFALVMFGFAYYLHSGGNAALVLLYAILAAGELVVGLFKWLVPIAEGLILDALVLLVFALFNFGISYIQFKAGRWVNPLGVFFGLYMLHGAFRRVRDYAQLRKMFANKPEREHIEWFDDLVREIQVSDPHSDSTALDLPTEPHWRAKLLGNIAFFVSANGNSVWVAGPEDFTLKRERTERGKGYRKALLSIYGENYPEFDLDDVSWENYQKWMANQVTDGLLEE